MTATAIPRETAAPPVRPIGLFESVREDVAAIIESDPAASNWLEVLLCYSGLHAVWTYRINHWLWSHGFRLLARWLSQGARLFTGIEIHPAAQIGHRLSSTTAWAW